jgi:hypothetical protein
MILYILSQKENVYIIIKRRSNQNVSEKKWFTPKIGSATSVPICFSNRIEPDECCFRMSFSDSFKKKSTILDVALPRPCEPVAVNYQWAIIHDACAKAAL